MDERLPSAWVQRRDIVARLASGGHTAAIAKLLELSSDADQALIDGELGDLQWSSLKFSCSSLLTNLGTDRRDRAVITAGIECAQQILDDESVPEFRGNVEYNIANGLAALNMVDREEWHTAEPDVPRSVLELRDRDRLRRVRSLFARVGYSAEHGDLPARALCNLGNALDHSGRWLEAYQAYVDALAADPTNGNAAELLRIRAARGRGLSGHYAAVYDKYRKQAQQHRARTVEVAGEEVACRWDALPPSGSQGHLSHDGNALDEYQQWIKRHRLALTVAVEGLGSDDLRWDSAMIEAVSVGQDTPDPPLIFTSMNVLKAEYLVARRLAYDGETRLTDSMFEQDPADPGTYADTLDLSIYGEPTAQLVLAQRATLDLLDKIAVAANDHFQSGVEPTKVNFFNYWRLRDDDRPRAELPVPDQMVSAAAALAELAYDIDDDGMYPEAKVLRNAGTHRLVHVTHLAPTGVTKKAHSSVDAEALIRATHQSLRVARSAYIYLIDLIQDQQESIDDELRVSLPLPLQY
ncbi:LA2681 family HEPN domain-containing protein [Plantibacter sp. M259]|uniref:LA2681 family HEPN domain-containing protein n=1 Tax=Plantibacter sp. M259 TaxID=2583822 RepID=UPI00111039D4|nr:LA2681 family HEPN domain-containing protein [Plantibacter sp. M259]